MVTTDVHAPVEHVLEATSHIGEVRFGGGEAAGGQIESALTRIKFHALRPQNLIHTLDGKQVRDKTSHIHQN